jgi:hypothetical protein
MGAASDDEHGASEPTASDDATATTPPPRGRGIDLTGALGMAGHEVELLHAEDVEDTAPVLGQHASGNDLDLDVAASSVLRGMDAGMFSPDDEAR